MHIETNVYSTRSRKTVSQFVADFAEVVKINDFVINNSATMNMRETFGAHGGIVPDDFDLHMIQVCKPTKADKSLATNPERAILMPKFVHVFSKDDMTQIRYLSYTEEQITGLIPNDTTFPESLAQTFRKIRAMIDEAC